MKRRKTNEHAENYKSHRFDKTSPKGQGVYFFHVSLSISRIVKSPQHPLYRKNEKVK
jgi:hypothetical protein